MTYYESLFKDKLDEIKAEGRYRSFVPLSRIKDLFPYAVWHKDDGTEIDVAVWCTNDYLNMTHNKQIVQAFQEAALYYGVGSGGTRNISGTAYPHLLLEREMADLHKKEAALIFASGYAANEGTLSALGSAFDDMVLFCDEKNHASMIQGVRSTKAERYVFSHNDMQDLERHLKKFPINQPKLIAVISVYSMMGDFAKLHELSNLAKQYNALLYVDEVHAVGIYGPEGAGLVAQMNLDVDIIQGNFAKGYGVVGGYIAGSSAIVDYVRSSASSFIFTTSQPPAVSQAALESVRYLRRSSKERDRLWENVNLLKSIFDRYGIPYSKNTSHIIPLILGEKCKQLCDELLLSYKIYLQPINYPTVPRGKEMVRITVTPEHTKDMMIDLAQAFAELLEENIILTAA